MKVISEKSFGGLAALTGVAAVGAMASCCVLPTALAVIGLGGVGGSFFVAGAEARLPITILAVLVVAGGWAMYWRARRQCETGVCERPSRAVFWLLASGTAFVALALSWTPIVEPFALKELLRWRQ